ncbi:hypothetical protein BSL78_27706 [Apostichopus japonicus]|uniref:Inner centromere protein ARK-binding domain-containing protein n=1 Tax=Stichopus japonicus TaxID=307972 RepID=A0A2G8JIB1_STIJA|nr:hypothetical protein BSL78_27706 [Apostichopus japonicus]
MPEETKNELQPAVQSGYKKRDRGGGGGPAESIEASAKSATSGTASEDGEPHLGSARCDPNPATVEEEQPVRRSTRKRLAPRSRGTLRGTRTSKQNTIQSQSSDDSGKSVRLSRNKKAKLEVPEGDAAATSKSETTSVIDPPPRNSPRQEVEMYYKDRVKRLINHHEKLMVSNSEDEFTPPKRKKVVRAAQKKAEISNASTARATRSRRAKVGKGGEKSENEASKEETETEEEEKEENAGGCKNADVLKDERTQDKKMVPDEKEKEGKGTREGGISDTNQLDGPAEKAKGNKSGGTDEVDSTTPQKIASPKVTATNARGVVHRVFGITSQMSAVSCTPPRAGKAPTPVTPSAPGTSTRAMRSRIVKPIKGGGGGRTKEIQHEDVETVEEQPPIREEISESVSKSKTDPEEKVETTADMKETEAKVLEGEKSSEEEGMVGGKDKGDGVTTGNSEDERNSSRSEVSETSDEKEGDVNEGEKITEGEEMRGDEEEEDEDVIPPSPKSVTSEGPESLDATASADQRVLRRSSRQSTATKRQRSSIMKSRSQRRSSNYHRFKTRQSRVSTVGGQQLGPAISEELNQEERRLTRSRAKRMSEEGGDTVIKENATLKRKSQESDDGTCPGRASKAAVAGGKKSPEEQRFTPDNYDRSMNPNVKSFLNPGYTATKKNSLHVYKTGQVASFIKRNTPLKKTQKDRKQEIVEKQKREEEVRRKLEDERKQRLEEMKQKREERSRKVAEARARRIQMQSEKKKKLEEKQEQKMALSNKQKEDKRREELERRLKLTKKKVEAEERRRQEEEARLQKLREQEELKKRQEEFIQRKKEYEEQERTRKLEEGRRLGEQRRLDAEKQREEMEKKIQLQNKAHEMEMLERKEEREREQKELERKRLAEADQRERERREREAAEADRVKAAQRALRDKERQEEQRHLLEIMKKEKERIETEKLREKEKAEQDRLKASILKHNTSVNQPTSNALNTTLTKETNKSPTSYEMTPQRIYVAASEENYGIDDLHSGDSTDDEDDPRKVIPKWAQGVALRDLCVKQYLHQNSDDIFAPVAAPNLELLFAKKRARFFKRTSSAVWNSPPLAANHRR